MTITGHLLVVLAIAGSVYTELCSDLDPALCTYLIEKAPYTCGDPCLSKYCKRSCNICPLQCYECNEIADVSHCTKVVECADPNDYCFIAQTFTTHFTEAYRQGCGSRQTCLQYASSTGTNLGGIEAGCCNQDKCNNKPATLLQLTSKSNNTYTAPDFDMKNCSNQNDDVCTRLSLYMTNPCTDDCIAANICPKMCKKCFQCLACNEVASPEICTDTTVCGFGKQCYGLEKLGSDFRPAVQLGCIDQQKCNDLQNTPMHIFGKRDFSFAGYCCSGERCNVRPLKDKTTVATMKPVDKTTTDVPTATEKTTYVPIVTEKTTIYPSSCLHNQIYQQGECPGFYHIFTNHTCYLESQHTKSKDSSTHVCRDNCGNLISFDTMEELSSLLNTIGNHYRQQHTDKYYWTDMERDTNGNWFWSQNGSPVSSSVLGSRHSQHLSYIKSHVCAVLHVTFSYGRVQSFYLNTEFCNRFHHQLCKHV